MLGVACDSTGHGHGLIPTYLSITRNGCRIIHHNTSLQLICASAIGCEGVYNHATGNHCDRFSSYIAIGVPRGLTKSDSYISTLCIYTYYFPFTA